MLTTVIRQFDQPAYPFDSNITSQSFVLKCLESGGAHFFDFDKKHMSGEFLISPNRDAFLFHELTRTVPLWVELDAVKATYLRRLHRLLAAYNSGEEILFCRHIIDADPYNDYTNSSWSSLPFVITYDHIKFWQRFLDGRRKTKLLLITNNPTLKCDHADIYIKHTADVRGDGWTNEVRAAIARFI